MPKAINIILHVIFFALLAYCTLVQFNDPDSYLWIIFYGACCAVPILSLSNKENIPLNWVLIGAGSVILGSTLPGFIEYLDHSQTDSLTNSMSPDKPYIELAREFLGALFAFLVVVGYQVMLLRKKDQKIGK